MQTRTRFNLKNSRRCRFFLRHIGDDQCRRGRRALLMKKKFLSRHSEDPLEGKNAFRKNGGEEE